VTGGRSIFLELWGVAESGGSVARVAAK